MVKRTPHRSAKTKSKIKWVFRDYLFMNIKAKACAALRKKSTYCSEI
jgi:hypothetical protein